MEQDPQQSWWHDDNWWRRYGRERDMSYLAVRAHRYELARMARTKATRSSLVSPWSPLERMAWQARQIAAVRAARPARTSDGQLAQRVRLRYRRALVGDAQKKPGRRPQTSPIAE